MSKVFIFDVDGTLTPSRLPMNEEFQKFFSDWSMINKFYLVTGSDLPKLKEQMRGLDIHSHGIFTCCGNEYWQTDPAVHPNHADNIYSNKFKPPETLLTYLGFQIKMSDFPIRAGNHREDRGSMLNFSIVGRDCTLEERQQYFEWDNQNGERERIAKEVRDGWPGIDAVIGGQISIDIYPEGNDKSQILDIIKQETIVEPDEYIFIGDRTMEGGNDYPLAKLMEKTENCKYYQTESWEQTQKILEKLKND